MRVLGSSLILLAALATAPSARAGSDWGTDYQKALAAAKKDNKLILADFTGSDWCGWCIKLDEEVFSRKEFQAWAKKNVVLLQLDFPQSKKLDAKLVEQNAMLRDKHGVTGYPTILFLDAEGKNVGKMGYMEGGPEAWLAKADEVISAASSGWIESFDDALALSKKTKKPILVDFTGSDWCSWCIKLDEEVFSKKEFQTWAKDNVVLLKLDYPHQKPQSEELKKQNQKLLQKYGIQGYPTVLFLDATGEKIGQMGYQPGGPAPWIEKAGEFVKKGRRR